MTHNGLPAGRRMSYTTGVGGVHLRTPSDVLIHLPGTPNALRLGEAKHLALGMPFDYARADVYAPEGRFIDPELYAKRFAQHRARR